MAIQVFQIIHQDPVNRNSFLLSGHYYTSRLDKLTNIYTCTIMRKNKNMQSMYDGRNPTVINYLSVLVDILTRWFFLQYLFYFRCLQGCHYGPPSSIEQSLHTPVNDMKMMKTITWCKCVSVLDGL